MKEFGMEETTMLEKTESTKNTIKTIAKAYFQQKMENEGKNKSKINYLKQGTVTWEAGKLRLHETRVAFKKRWRRQGRLV